MRPAHRNRKETVRTRAGDLRRIEMMVRQVERRRRRIAFDEFAPPMPYGVGCTVWPAERLHIFACEQERLATLRTGDRRAEEPRRITVGRGSGDNRPRHRRLGFGPALRHFTTP